MSNITLCACGMPLHYENPVTRFQVDMVIAHAGGDPFVRVTSQSGVFMVQRHYIALHGLCEADLNGLAELGIIWRIG